MYRKSAELIKKAKRAVAFTGAGISVESGIPAFRGNDGLWARHDPRFLEIDYFVKHPAKSWEVNKEVFYTFFGKALPNRAHRALAVMEEAGLIKAVITQNIDNLHFLAQSRNVYEFHGNSRNLVCLECEKRFPVEDIGLEKLPPLCRACGGILKPDFVFFGEAIPETARILSFREAEIADVFLLIGTTGQVAPASLIPRLAKRNGAEIIEINIEESEYTDNITDIFLRATAVEGMTRLAEALGLKIEG